MKHTSQIALLVFSSMFIIGGTNIQTRVIGLLGICIAVVEFYLSMKGY